MPGRNPNAAAKRQEAQEQPERPAMIPAVLQAADEIGGQRDREKDTLRNLEIRHGECRGCMR